MALAAALPHLILSGDPPPPSLSLPSRGGRAPFSSLLSAPLHSSLRNFNNLTVSAATPHSSPRIPLESKQCGSLASQGPIMANMMENPPVMPDIMTPVGPLDLATVLFRNRIIFIGEPVFSEVAQRVISQLVTLATIDENSDILIYINSPGGSVYSVLAVYDCMSWIKPRVGTVCFGVCASHASILLAGGEKGMRYAMPNARIMIHQPQATINGSALKVRGQVAEAVHSRHKIDQMYAAFTGQPFELIQEYTELDRFFSAAQAMDFGLIDGIMETEY
ncbi:hypothetical protein Droror1_Dr00006585 [Drosera rotundifolia]